MLSQINDLVLKGYVLLLNGSAFENKIMSYCTEYFI